MVQAREKIYFHIGLHKTATGWFQKCFFPSLSGINTYVIPQDDAIRRIARQKNGTHIISSESLSGTLSSQKQPGDYRIRTIERLDFIRSVAPNARIIVGFREQESWINSAYLHKAKKGWVSPAAYKATFAMHELLWCEILGIIRERFSQVFPFLYDEIAESPAALVDDICSFLGCSPPAKLETLVMRQINPSPQSALGLAVSRRLSQMVNHMGHMGIIADRRAGMEHAFRIGAFLDRYGTRTRPITFTQDERVRLQSDWVALSDEIKRCRCNR